MPDPTRRTFLKTSALAAASPNDRVRVAIVGLRGRGRDHIQSFHQMAGAGVEIATLCDVDETILR